MTRTEIKAKILEVLEGYEECFGGSDKPLLNISNTYHGLWMEHIYDSVIYASLYRNKLYLAENAINAFISKQRPDGQLPYILRATDVPERQAGYSQIQECVSFGSLALSVYRMNQDKEFLERAYTAVCKWVEWMKANRMTLGEGLVEMFFGFDTGHDNSQRVLDLGVPGSYSVNGVIVDAATLPPDDGITPVIATDMNCNFYGNLKALVEMSKILGKPYSAFEKEAKTVKQRLFEHCFDEEDCFFYDVDRNGKKRKILSSTVFHLFLEGVLDPKEDGELIHRICERYVFNEKHFFTPYPFPSVSVSDPSWKKHKNSNCWGYFTQSLIILRSTIWMERYGFEKEHREVFERFASAWEKSFGKLNFGQELDPITGEPSECSEWYSSCMLAYLYYTEKWADK